MADEKRTKSVTVVVNKQQVELPKERLTGAEIKAAAIAAGVLIQAHFVLSVKHGSRFDVVGDSDVTNVHQGLEFTVVDSDDNS